MKLTTLLLFVVLVQVSARSLSQTVTFTGKRVPLETVFSVIKKQTGYVVVYNKQLLKSVAPVDVQAKDMPLTEFLGKVLEKQKLNYRISVQTIFLSEKSKDGQVSLLLEAQQQSTLNVSGSLHDQQRQPIVGAVVQVKNKKRGATTDSEGRFVITQLDKTDILLISSLGFKSLEVPLSLAGRPNSVSDVEWLPSDGNNIRLGVTLTESVDSLTDVVVSNFSTGYQTVGKERATGSFVNIDPSSYKQQRLSSLSSLLEGRVSGYNNGLIRGTSTMNGIVNPLYVIDGFPIESASYDGSGSLTDNIPGLNLEDIETITILKDAAAASIYGARAANGVVVIVTKKGKKGKPQINASANFTYSPNYIYTGRLTDAADIVELEKEWAAANTGLQGTNAATYAQAQLDNATYTSAGTNAILNYYAGHISQAEMNASLNSLSAKGYKYYDDIKKYGQRNTMLQQHNISIGTANEKNAFYGSATFKKNALQNKNEDNQSLGINLKNSTTFNKWISLDLGTYLQYADNRTPYYNLESPGYNFTSYDPLVNDDGSYFTRTAASRLSASDLSIISQYNLYSMDLTPLYEFNNNIGKETEWLVRSFAKLNLNFTSWLSYQAAFQYETRNSRFSRLYDKSSYYVRRMTNSFATADASTGGATYNIPYGHIYDRETQWNNSYSFRQQLNLDKRFGGHHNITAIVGSETRNMKVEQNGQTLYNYDPNVLSFALINAEKLATTTGYLFGGSFQASNLGYDREIVNRFVSVYSNVGYSYDDKYLLTGSLRWDKSNLWGADAKSQNKPVWSGGLGWNIHREQFFRSDVINSLKLRGSYGIGGNISRNSAPYMVAYYYNNYNLGGQYGSISSRPNPNLTWEKTTTVNVGVDFGLFKNRLSGSVDYYNKRGNDLLANTMGVPTEGFGYSTYTINNGKMTNKGIELTLNSGIVRSRDWNWNLGATFAYNKNKVTYVNVTAPVYYLQLDYPEAYPVIGNAFNAVYAYDWAGLSAEGLPQVYDGAKNKTTATPTTLDAIKYAGTTVPKYSGSFNSSLEYKNFTFAFLLTYEGGHVIRNTDLPLLNNQYSSAIYTYVTTFSAVNKNIVNRWRTPGDENKTNIPKAVFAEDPSYNSEMATMYAKSSINVLSARNIRLRNISLAYTLPQQVVKKAALQGVRFQFNIENLVMLTGSKEAKYMLGGFIRPNYVGGVYVTF